MSESRNDGTASILPLAAAAVAVWLLLSGGGVQPPGPEPGPEPEPAPVTDPVGTAFSEHERLWRLAAGDLAKRLRSGEVKSEAAATEWFGAANREAQKRAFTPLVEAEYEQFGGDKWTAEKHAAALEGYANE